VRRDRIRRGRRPEVLGEAERVDVEEPHSDDRIAMILIGERLLGEKWRRDRISSSTCRMSTMQRHIPAAIQSPTAAGWRSPRVRPPTIAGNCSGIFEPRRCKFEMSRYCISHVIMLEQNAWPGGLKMCLAKLDETLVLPTSIVLG
jgi:hypothetical protein